MDDKKGYVYIFTNPSMPDYIKIGYTMDLKRRLHNLDTTGIPTPFEPYFTVQTKKYQVLEKVIHRELDKLTNTRARKNREFFKIDPEIARDLLLNVSELLDDGTTNDFGNEATNDIRKKDGTVRPMSKPTTFAMLGILPGTQLEPIAKKYPRAVTVDDKNLVRLEDGEEKTISRAVVDVTGSSLNGFSCYKYNGEKLTDIRKKFDENYFAGRKH